MVTAIGFDIGGANIKAAFISTNKQLINEVNIAADYFPIWKKNSEDLRILLLKLQKKVSNYSKAECVGVTMTAELSDTFLTKREGVCQVLEDVARVFPDTPIFVVDIEAKVRLIQEAKSEPLKVAAANWAATGWMVSQLIENCIVIDVGSTSTSIVPVVKGKLEAIGKTDLEKLISGELVYTGSLRTNIATIVSSIPVRGDLARVSAELFALSGDVHLILGNIKENEYTTETADGKGKNRKEAMARLARVVCADTEMLTEKEILQIAGYVLNRQIEQVSGGLSQVYSRIKSLVDTEIIALVTGLGKDFLARTAAERVGFKKIVDLEEVTAMNVAKASPALGAALMAASELIGESVKWKQW